MKNKCTDNFLLYFYQDFFKVLNSIKSCKNEDQLENSKKMWDFLQIKWDDVVKNNDLYVEYFNTLSKKYKKVLSDKIIQLNIEL